MVGLTSEESTFSCNEILFCLAKGSRLLEWLVVKIIVLTDDMERRSTMKAMQDVSFFTTNPAELPWTDRLEPIEELVFPSALNRLAGKV